MQLSGKRLALGVLFLACVVGLVVGLLSGRASSQAPLSSEPGIGRYQLIPAGSAMNPFVYFLDTETGQCWLAYTPADSLHKEGWHRVPVLAGR